MTGHRWPGEWLRGVLRLCILAAVAEQGQVGIHGYAIAQRLTGQGLGEVKGGTLYPILNRLEEEGLLTAAWVAGTGGPGRKTFVATPSGREHLEALRVDWKTFSERATHLIDTGSRA